LRQLNPNLRVSNLKEVLGPYRQEDLSQYEEALRRAELSDFRLNYGGNDTNALLRIAREIIAKLTVTAMRMGG
jgi:hypothetical protein